MTETSLRAFGDRIRETAAHTTDAVGLVLSRRRYRALALGVGGLYLLVYLYAVGDFGLYPGADTGIRTLVVEDPLDRVFDTSGAFRFEPVARVVAGPLTILVSLNLLLGVVLAGLVGLNVALATLTLRQPAACGIEEGSRARGAVGVVALAPGLLTGSACCGPVILLVLGIQASGVLLSAFAVLLPVALVTLVGGLVLTARQVGTA